MNSKLLKIAVTGPESTGKSILTEQLAHHYHTNFVPEYAREYIDKLQRPYNQEDILVIAQNQILNEHTLEKQANQIIFCDTELIVTKIWSEVKYSSCDPWILKTILENPYDLYLLCNIDIPWVDDPQREHPQMREYLFNLYFRELTDRKVSFAIVNGLGMRRLHNAVRIIEKYFGSRWNP
ncbi:MAG: ATP-binding protein [Bacteroidota bacterium]|nr:ATP-binding protein [Bacteroidota bacterium]